MSNIFSRFFFGDNREKIKQENEIKVLEDNIKNLEEDFREELDRLIETLNGQFDIVEKNLIHFSNSLHDMVLFIDDDLMIYEANDRAKKRLNLELNNMNRYGFIFDIFKNNKDDCKDSRLNTLEKVFNDQIMMYNENEENSPLKTSEEFEKEKFCIENSYGDDIHVLVSISMQKRSDGTNYWVMIIKEIGFFEYLCELKPNCNLGEAKSPPHLELGNQ